MIKSFTHVIASIFVFFRWEVKNNSSSIIQANPIIKYVEWRLKLPFSKMSNLNMLL